MKKSLLITFLVACAFLFCACSNLDENTKIYDKPPALTVKCGTQEVNALLGTHTWNWTDVDGALQGVASDHAHPLNIKEHVPVLNATNQEAILQFEDAPDTVSVVCWSDDYWNDTSTEGEEIVVSDNSFELNKGGYVYQIRATWNDKTKYYGDATYSFYANLN